jgi:hypothetical protein
MEIRKLELAWIVVVAVSGLTALALVLMRALG